MSARLIPRLILAIAGWWLVMAFTIAPQAAAPSEMGPPSAASSTTAVSAAASNLPTFDWRGLVAPASAFGTVLAKATREGVNELERNR